MRTHSSSDSLFPLSCAVGPDYKRPQTDADDRFRMAEGSVRCCRRWPTCPGGISCKMNSCSSSFESALAENKDLQQAVATVEEFRARALDRQIRLSAGNYASVEHARLAARRTFSFPALPARSTIICWAICPGRSISGGGSGGPTKRRAPICYRKKRTDAR